jgi:integrase
MASLQRVNGRYVLQWRDAQGQHKKVLGRVGILTKSEADRILRAKQYELDTGRNVLGPAPSAFFDDFVRDYLAWHYREFPDSHYRVRQIIDDHLLPAFKNRRLGEITPRDVETWKQDRGERVKSATVVKELRTLKAILNKAVEWDEIHKNPIVHVDPPRILDSKPKRFYTIEEIGLLLPQPHGPIWRLYVNTGMRRGEGMMLRREWIKADAIQILSEEEARTKSGKWREVPLTEGARAALEELPGADYVLPRMRLESLSRLALREAKRAGLDGGIHTLRHTYISHLVMQGTDLRTVQHLAGHSSITVTEGYAHLAPGHVARAGIRVSF